MAKRDRDESADQAQSQEAPTSAPATGKLPEFREVKLQGDIYKLPFRFPIGTVLDEAKATFFNSAHQGYALNAFGDRAKAIKEQGVDAYNKEHNTTHMSVQDAVNDELQTYYAEYEWSPRGSAEVLDPVERESLKIARTELDLAVRAAGKTLKGLDPAFVTEKVREHFAANETRIRKEANAKLNSATANVGSDFLGALFANGQKPAPAANTEAA